MPSPEDVETRRDIANRFVRGRGVEVGAGADPSSLDGADLTYIDSRSQSELQALFNAPIAYEVRSLSDVLCTRSGSSDFLVAHHVLEHCPDPIGQVVAWLPLLRDSGRLFVSTPSDDNTGEYGRVPATISHLLHDHLFERSGGDFDSKQHIPHFIIQWTAMSSDSFWFSKYSAQDFCTEVLTETRRDGHDVHWHTYTIEALSQVIEAAFWFGGRGLTWLHRETANGAHYLVAEVASRAEAPPFLITEYAALLRAIQKFGGPASGITAECKTADAA
jgi:hypothetical protein